MLAGQEVPAAIGRDRVREHTSPKINAKIDADLRARAREYAETDSRHLAKRLGKLDREWDVDRVLFAHFAAFGLWSLGRLLRDWSAGKKASPWRYPVGAQFAFALLYAAFGWAPPIVLYRRIGCRTQREIDAEREAILTELRGRTAQLQR